MESYGIYPISYVSRQTGLAAHLIRTWESRYQAVNPLRSKSNRRLYCDEDILRLRMLNRLVKAGHSISQVAGLSHEELADLERIYSSAKSGTLGNRMTPTANCSQFIQASLRSAINLDIGELEGTLNAAAVNLTRPKLMFDVVVPLQARLLKMVEAGKLRYVQLNVANTVIRTFLWDMLRTVAIADSAPRLVVAAPTGHYDEISALILAATAVESGWRPLYLGTNLSSDDIAAAVEHCTARAVVIRLIQGAREDHVKHELLILRQMLPSAVSILVCCGDGLNPSEKDEYNIVAVERLDNFRQCLESLPGNQSH